ncbi:penicillin-binding protein 1C [Sanyastnella coralliicola]|uniref:penicillin-binding protein 1C n=1 Tax=Sanyastnella coralliicola TaxID=3069118 RepID=UPI0027B8E48D|nr:penicillin-binding protein 1C [Longitalea sp. SCSIO 12813]
MKRPLRKYLKRTRQVITLAFVVWFIGCLPNPLFDKPNSPSLYDRNDKLLAARVAEDGQWRFVKGDSVPERFAAAIVAFEDRHFYKHPGVYPPSLARALWENLTEGKVVRGGSTITMQVIRMSRDNPGRTYFEKFTEIFRALRLEFSYSKEEVLALYSANAPMGGNVVGLEAASWRYFGCSPHQLTWAESATLAVLPNAPSLIHPGKNRDSLKEKRNRLLQTLFEEGHFDALTLELSLEEELPLAPKPLPQQAMHLLNELEQEKGQQRFPSTLDQNVQSSTQNIVDRHHTHLSSNLVHNAAAIVVETETGEVVAYIGNASKSDRNRHVNIVTAPRSPGSALKPFLYMAMLDKGLLSPEELIEDTPLNLRGFNPNNFDKKFNGMVPAHEALARSLNVPAVIELQRYGVAPFKQQLNQLGFEHLNRSADHYGLSLILGGGEVTLWELANAYRMMGEHVLSYVETSGRPPAKCASIYVDPEKALNEEFARRFSPGSSHACLEALKNVKRPVSELGWEMMDGSRSISWKTGTSYGFRDAWAVGVTAKYTVAVWVGNADGTGRPGVIGAQAAAPLMFDIFDALPERGNFPTPHDDLVEVETCIHSGMIAGRNCLRTSPALIPSSSYGTEVCKYHQKIHLSPDGNYRVHLECAPEVVDTTWFVLPPVEAWYYAQSHPEYSYLPDWHPACDAASEVHHMAIMQPKHGDQLVRARDLDGILQPLVFESIAPSGTLLHWHLDDNYLGSTRGIHQLEVEPSIGNHVLMILDEAGNSDLVAFQVGVVR